MRWLFVVLVLGACGDQKAGPDASLDSSVDASPDAPADAPDPNMPATLAATGLCVDAGCTQIASGVYAYAPRFELWSDTASKRRWIALPPGTQINTTDMDHWSFPVGTKLWKEFTRNGVRVETRLVMRVGAGDTVNDWFYAAYLWNQTQDATTWAEFGQVDGNGTGHDVPSKFLCRQCHENNKPSRVLGFSAIQLDFDGVSGDIDLADAVANNWLSAPPTAPGSPGPYFPFPVASTSYEYPALGYMHANCGHCHNPNSVVASNTTVMLRLTVASLSSLAATAPYQTAVNATTLNTVNGHDTIVKAGVPNESVLIDRFESPLASLRMPVVGTEMLDTTAQATLRAWITNIP